MFDKAQPWVTAPDLPPEQAAELKWLAEELGRTPRMTARGAEAARQD